MVQANPRQEQVFSSADIDFLRNADLCKATLNDKYRMLVPLCLESADFVIYLAEDLQSREPRSLVVKILPTEHGQYNDIIREKLRQHVAFFQDRQRKRDDTQDQTFQSNYVYNGEGARLKLPEDQNTIYRVHYLAIKYQWQANLQDYIDLILKDQNGEEVQAHFSEVAAKRLCWELAKGLEVMHHNFASHCDLNPSSLPVKDNNQMFLCDTGHLQMNPLGLLIASARGSAGYRSPEITKAQLVDLQKADIFAFAVTCFVIRHGSVPFALNEDCLPLDATESPREYKIFLVNKAKATPNSFFEFFVSMIAPNQDERPSIKDILSQENWLSGADSQEHKERAKAELAQLAQVMLRQKPQIKPKLLPPESEETIEMTPRDIDFKELQLNNMDCMRIRKHGFWSMQDLQCLASNILGGIKLNQHRAVVCKRACTIVCTAQADYNEESRCVYQVEFCKHPNRSNVGKIFVHMSKIQGDALLFNSIVQMFIMQFGQASSYDPDARVREE